MNFGFDHINLFAPDIVDHVTIGDCDGRHGIYSQGRVRAALGEIPMTEMYQPLAAETLERNGQKHDIDDTAPDDDLTNLHA